MKKFLHILCIIGLVLLLYACSGGPRVIPRGKMAKIYAEMLLTDQWISTTPGVMRMADTSLVYEPILESYGYNSADYRKSVEHYMEDPERYSRILRSASEILGKRLDELNALKKALEEAVVVIKTSFVPEDYFPYISREPYIHYYDSLSVEADTVGYYRLIPIERSDTTYDGLRMIVRVETEADSLSVADSTADGDAPALADSLSLVGKSSHVGGGSPVDKSSHVGGGSPAGKASHVGKASSAGVHSIRERRIVRDSVSAGTPLQVGVRVDTALFRHNGRKFLKNEKIFPKSDTSKSDTSKSEK